MRVVSPAIGTAYRAILKPILFRMDPEKVHDAFTAFGRCLGGHRPLRGLTRSLLAVNDPRLSQDIRGIRFPNPVGLAAGFDKNGRLPGILPDVGFGFAEIGSVTGEPCEGNPKPRLWRMKRSRSLAVWYGLMNDGAGTVAARLESCERRIPIGVSVAKTNCAATAADEPAIADYRKAFDAVRGVADYVTVNISCPNAYGGQPFNDAARLDALLSVLDGLAYKGPVFLKMSPDQQGADLEAIVRVASRHRVDGFIASNLTKRPEPGRLLDPMPPHGALSGAVVRDAADLQLRSLRAMTGDRYTLIGCGGIFSAEDAYRKIRLGASLVQLITGMIFEGPQLIGEINRGLLRLLDRDGFRSIREAVGADAR